MINDKLFDIASESESIVSDLAIVERMIGESAEEIKYEILYDGSKEDERRKEGILARVPAMRDFLSVGMDYVLSAIKKIGELSDRLYAMATTKSVNIKECKALNKQGGGYRYKQLNKQNDGFIARHFHFLYSSWCLLNSSNSACFSAISCVNFACLSAFLFSAVLARYSLTFSIRLAVKIFTSFKLI